MRFFSTGLDIKKDGLRILFNRGVQQYAIYSKQGKTIPSFKLNRRSQVNLEKRNKMLISVPGLLAEEMNSSINMERYHKLIDLGYPCTSFEVLYSSRNIDAISDDLMEYLRELTSEDNVLIGIHRTGRSSLDDINNILRTGLTMSNLNCNTTSSTIELRNNVSYYPNNETVIKELMNADCFKDSLGSILIRIPDEDLPHNIFYVNSETNEVILNPDYIIGFVPVQKNGCISEIITTSLAYSGSPFKEIESLYDKRDYASSIVVENSAMQK